MTTMNDASHAAKAIADPSAPGDLHPRTTNSDERIILRAITSRPKCTASVTLMVRRQLGSLPADAMAATFARMQVDVEWDSDGVAHIVGQHVDKGKGSLRWVESDSQVLLVARGERDRPAWWSVVFATSHGRGPRGGMRLPEVRSLWNEAL